MRGRAVKALVWLAAGGHRPRVPLGSTGTPEHARFAAPHAAVVTTARALAAIALVCSLDMAASASAAPTGRTFATPEEAVRALADVVKSGDMTALLAIFGPDGQTLVSSSDPATGRKHQEVFLAAFSERWRLNEIAKNRKELVIGNEDWPFPVPLAKGRTGWFFDSAAGLEEVISRRVGRNELAVIEVCRTYVRAQHAYAATGRDGAPPNVYARRLRSTAGRHDGLYWPAEKGQPRSPLGDLVAAAAKDGTDLATERSDRVPFHGYYFRILEAQGAHAPGGAVEYVANGRMSGDSRSLRGPRVTAPPAS